MNTNRLYRAKRDKKISGLCGGLAQFLGVDSTLVRLITVIAAFCSFGTIVAIYLICSLVIPEEPQPHFDMFDENYHY